MTEPTGPYLSVRAEAQRTVAPDSAVLSGGVVARSKSKAAALAAAASATQELLADVGRLGGVTAGVENDRPPLTWSVYSTSSSPEYGGHEKPGPNGFIIATASVRLTVRDFARLDDLGDTLARHETFSLWGVGWEVDRDNPVWREVRAAAIRAAIVKARDYAAALGGTLARLEHVADTGLLGGRSDAAPLAHRASMARGMAMVGGEAGSPSLDPVPQELIASIEARFVMTAVSLA